MITINFDPFPVLETERLTLRKPEMKDVPELFVYRSDREYMRFIPHRFVTTIEQVEGHINLMHSLLDKNEGINWAITKKGDDTILGLVGYVRFNNAHHRAEIGYMLHTPYHGTGIMKEAAERVIKYGFEDLKLHSIEAVVNHDNIPSKRLLEKMGFTKDAFFKDYLHHDGKYMSANVYSLVKED